MSPRRPRSEKAYVIELYSSGRKKASDQNWQRKPLMESDKISRRGSLGSLPAATKNTTIEMKERKEEEREKEWE